MTHPLLARHLLSHEQLKDRISHELLTTKIDSFDALLDGLPRGAITEIAGAPTSGRTSFMQAFLAAATCEGEFCAVVDACDTFDPHTAAASGADLTRLLWVRCGGSVEQAIRCADLLIHSGGWGVIVLDLAGLPPESVRRLPLSWWYRFRRAVENTPAVLLILEREPFVKACASLALDMQPARALWSGGHPDFRLLRGTQVEVRPKKPVRSQTAHFETLALA